MKKQNSEAQLTNHRGRNSSNLRAATRQGEGGPLSSLAPKAVLETSASNTSNKLHHPFDVHACRNTLSFCKALSRLHAFLVYEPIQLPLPPVLQLVQSGCLMNSRSLFWLYTIHAEGQDFFSSQNTYLVYRAFMRNQI